MTKNKSIDGLTSRRAKKSVSSSRLSMDGISTAHPRSTSDISGMHPKRTTIPITAYTPGHRPTRKVTKTSQVNLDEFPDFDESFTPAEVTREQITEDFLDTTHPFGFDEETGDIVAMKKLKSDEENKKSKRASKRAETKEPSKKGKKPRKKMSKKRKITLWVLGIILFLVIAATVILVIWGNDIIARITGGRGNIIDFFTESYEPLKTDENGRTNILAIGTSGFDMQGTDFDQSTHDGANLTDSIMIISFDQNTGDTSMISLPRDLKVSSSCTGTYKVNEVYWCNNLEGDDESAGATALMDEVSDILGIDLQYYAHLNWGSLESVVDTLGGVDITLDEGIYDYDYTGAVYEPGVEYHINGFDAVAIARARHGTENGDFSRGASQQKILIGIKDKVISEGLSVTELINLANTLGDNLRTNFSVSEMKSLAHLAGTIDFNNIQQISFLEPEPLMTTAEIYGVSYVIPSAGDGDYSDIQAYIKKMLSSEPRLREDVSILVLNATGQPGVAAGEQVALENDGYTNISVDDAPAGNYTDDYTLYTLTDTAPATLEFLQSKYNTTALPANSLPAGIPQDDSFVLVINTVPTN